MKQNLKKKHNEGSKRILQLNYNKLVLEFKNIQSDITLKKWKILSSAYKTGKELYGINYNISTLCIDFDIPYTSAKRWLSLNKANPKTLKRIKDKEISAFKVAQILSTKDTKRQDEIVEKAINENLSTYKIKQLQMNKIISLKDTGRLTRNFEKFYNIVNRLELFLDLDKSDFKDNHIEVIDNKLIILKNKIDIFLEKLK